MIRRLCWFATAFSAAVFLSVYLIPQNLLFPAGILCAAGILLALFFHGKNRKRIRLASIGLALGLLWTGCYGLLLRTPAHTLACDDPVLYTMELTDFPSESQYGSVFSVKLLLPDGFPQKVQLYAGSEALSLQPGDIISAQVRLSVSDQIRGESVDYFDSKGIYLLGYVRGDIQIQEQPSSPSLRYLPRFVAKAIQDLIPKLFPEDVSGYITALLTGDKSTLPTGLYTAFQRSGIAHVVAVSGLHLTFLFGLFTAIFGKRSRIGGILGLLLVFFYAAMVGFTPSAFRSALMIGLLFLAPLTGREEDKPTTLSTVLAILLIFCPYAARSVSLQLSFAAVAGIYLLSGKLSEQWLTRIPKWRSKLGRLARGVLIFLLTSLSVTLGALLFTTPLTAIHFQSVSLAGVLTNLLTLWAVTVTFYGGLLAAFSGLFLFPLGVGIAWLTTWPARWIIWVASGISRWPHASIPLLSVALVGWFVVSYGIILLWLAFHKSIRPWFPPAVIAGLLVIVLILNAWPALFGSLTVVALDVGQGSSTLLCSKGHAILVDCGGNSVTDPGDLAADYLQAFGITHLDALILTHYHTDHANGVPALLSRMDIGTLILPDVDPESSLRQDILSLAGRSGCDVELLYNYDTTVIFGDATLQIYTPLGDGGANEEGLSALCSVGSFDVLMTGDMNDIVEGRLLRYKALPDIELLVVGHHGSSTSTSESFLREIKPEYAVISVGRGNSYGHPTEQTLSRLGAAGCEIYRTDWMGTITFTLGASGFS